MWNVLSEKIKPFYIVPLYAHAYNESFPTDSVNLLHTVY